MMRMKMLLTMALFASAALVPSLGNCSESQDSLVGVWQANVQPDKKKIDRVLKEGGMIKPLRLLVGPKLSKQLKAAVIDLEFRSDGTCYIEDLSFSEGDDPQPAVAPKSRTWNIVSHEGNRIKVQVTTFEENKKSSKKLWDFTFDKDGALKGADADWHDAPFATPRFVRVRSASRSAATRR